MPGVDIFNPETYDYTRPSIVLFATPQEFSEYIELSASHRDVSLTTALIEYCELSDLDYDNLSSMLTNTIKEKIALEMQEDGLMQKTSRLEFED
jgi:hypothetical protein